jgi:hypothetical protein
VQGAGDAGPDPPGGAGDEGDRGSHGRLQQAMFGERIGPLAVADDEMVEHAYLHQP